MTNDMFSVIGVKLNESDNNTLYTDLFSGDKLRQLKDIDSSIFTNAPTVYKRMYEKNEKFYVTNKNLIFSHMKNHLNMFSLNNNGNYYYSYMIAYPSSIKADAKTTVMIEAIDATNNKKVYNLIGKIKNYELDVNKYFYEGCITNIELNYLDNKINCIVIDGTYILTLNGKRYVLDSLLEAETYIKTSLIDNEFITSSNVDEVMEPLFNLIKSYVSVETVKTHK